VLQKIHEYGYVFNDLKPDNILIGDIPLYFYFEMMNQKKSIDKKKFYQIHLVDFGLTTSYKDEDGKHIKSGLPDKFKGSMLFASKNAFNFVMTSRRDDFIALCYLMVYLIDENQLKFIQQVEGMTKK
jgi:serine/threonine protein kinase